MDHHDEPSEAAKGGGQKPVGEGEGEDGLGTKSGGLSGHDEDTSAGEDRPQGGAEDGPVKEEESVPGGGDATGPTPGGVPQEGDNNPDPDISTGST